MGDRGGGSGDGSRWKKGGHDIRRKRGDLRRFLYQHFLREQISL